MTHLHSKTAVVTGGSRGIGLAIAARLLADGANVAISGTNEQHLARAVQSLSAAAGAEARVLPVRSDVRDPEDAERLVHAAAQRFDGLDILVNNAGVGVFGPVADMAVDEWRRVMDTNLSGVFYCTRAAIPYMRRRGAGWIVNISSLASKNPFPEGAAYAASKAALNAFSEALMQEVRHDGIRVSYILPGSVQTSFGRAGAKGGTEWKLAPEDVAQAVADLLAHPGRSLPSRVELRPSRPPRR